MRAPFSRTLFDVVGEMAARSPSAPAVMSGSSTFSYGELAERARRVAAAFRNAGVTHGERVGLLISNRIEWVELCLGAMGAGATVVPFSTWSTRQELDFLIADAGISHLVALSRFGDRNFASDLAVLMPGMGNGARPHRYPRLRRVTLIGGAARDGFATYEADFDGTSEPKDLAPGEAASGGDDGLVLYTSGSSANPKAVRLKQYGIVENGFNIGERMGIRPDDRVLLSAPLFWSYGSANCFPSVLSHGAALVLQEKFGAAESIELIERHGCTALYTLPGMTKSILTDPSFSRERVRTLRTGLTIGAPQDFMTAVEGLGASELCNVYGATETYGNCCVTWHHWPVAQRALCQGTPLPGNELRFVDVQTGQPVGPGEPGLTEVRGYVTAGYSGASSDQNALAFTPDGFYRTGDVGQLDENGAFVFVGRNTEMIKRAGINVSPAEVENILLLHSSVALAGVVGVPDPDRGELIVAFVVPEGDAKVSVDDLFAHCRSIASKYKLPDRIEVRRSLPQTPTGKLQRRELKGIAVNLMAAARG